ncbi:MAG: MoaD/ThiS family protein [Luminiphilus sp.]|nr:MoaD/ThiS family protein [Luminiphilus sp.]
MNIRIKLFATLREALGESEFDLSLATLVPSETPVDVAAVKALLSQRGVDWHEALNQPNVVHALNHKVVFTDALIAEGDELAFFPPMTGG